MITTVSRVIWNCWLPRGDRPRVLVEVLTSIAARDQGR